MQTRNQLSAPTACDNCSSDRIGLTSNAVIYGVPTGKWPYCFYCDDCGAMVNCHPSTHSPMGLMANGATRRKRQQLHRLFDPIWKFNYMSREEAYEWLGSQLNLGEECHIGHLTKNQLLMALDIMRPHASNEYALFKRRKEKNDSRRYARNLRSNARIGLRKSR